MSKEAFKAIMAGVKEAAADLGQGIVQELGDRVSEAKEFVGNVASDVGAELVHQTAMGSQEIAAALFRGSDGFVLYPHQNNNESPQHGLPETPQVDSPGREI